MTDEPQPARSVAQTGGPAARLVHWLLLGGNRLVVAGLLVVATVVLFYVLVARGVLAVGPTSSASTAFGSGLVSGTLTLVTVALSINQLILSRVFGSPNQLRDRLDGTRNLRETVRMHADEAVTPNDPAAFLETIGRALSEQGAAFGAALDAGGPAAASDYAEGIAAYGDSVTENVQPGDEIVDVLDVIVGPEYAQNLTATEYVTNEYGSAISDDGRAQLAVIDDLLETIAISRQFFKTMALQQDFARLSRILAYSGVVAVLTSVALTLVYRTSSVAVDPELLPLLVPLGIAVIVTPLAAFIAYVLRAATIARRTISVGPFVPPQEQSAGD
mgnify:CR=1 FL=1